MKSIFFIVFLCIGDLVYGQTNFEKGMIAFNQGLHYDATVFFSRAISKKEDLSTSYMMRGAALIQLNDFQSAGKDIDSSLQVDSINYLTFVYGGRNLFKQGLFAEAIVFYDKSIALKSDYESHFYERAICHMSLLSFDAAIVDFDRAIQLNPNEHTHYLNRGICKMKLNSLDEALKDFDAALLIQPNELSYANKGSVLLKLGRYEEAISNLTIALSAEPWNEVWNYERGLAYKALGKVELAKKDFRNSAASGFVLAKKELKN